MSTPSLDTRQIEVLDRIGDVYAPGDREYPRFSTLGCVHLIGRILISMPQSDLRDLKTLLSLLAILPGFMLRPLFHFIEWSPNIPGPIGAPFRMIRLGIRGLVMTLYYADPRVLTLLGYEVSVYTGDLVRPEPPRASAAPALERG